MKKSLLLVLIGLFMFGQTFGQWQKARLPANNAILSLAVDYATSYVYAGSAGNGVYLSADTGATWNTANTGLPANLNVGNILIKNKNIFLATDDGVYTSANKGISWEQAGLKSILVNSLTCYNSGDTTFLYAGTEKGIYLSKNNGIDWSLYAFPNQGVSTMYTNGIVFYAGMSAGGLNYYEDYRKNWAAADTGITNKTIIKTVSGGSVGTNHGLFEEKSKGNWIKANNGLGSDTIVNSIISFLDLYNQGFFPFLYTSLLSTGKDPGNIYSYHNYTGGYFWSALNTGIDGNVNALAMYRNIVFAGGSDLWVLKSDLKYLYLLDTIGELSAAGDTATFKIFTNDFWGISTLQYDWLTFSPNQGTGDATITVTATPNNTNNIRLGIATMLGYGGSIPLIYQAPVNTTDIANPSNTNITIYPVPVTDEMVISFPDQPTNTRFAIYNLSDVELLASSLTGNTTKVNLSGFNPGVYVLKIYSKNTSTTRKIVKQ